jgi:hypothetical protein
MWCAQCYVFGVLENMRGDTPKGVPNDVSTTEGWRRAEILGVARKRRAHRIAVFGLVANDLQF